MLYFRAALVCVAARLRWRCDGRVTYAGSYALRPLMPGRCPPTGQSGVSAHQRIVRSEPAEAREVAIGGPKLPDAVGDAKSCNAGVVN